jgi:hypothetical protein
MAGEMKSDLTYRTISLRADAPGTLNTEDRSVEAVGSTEDPVEVFDYERWEIIPEVLLMSGCILPANRQVPLLDTHMRYQTQSVIGSYRGMKIETDSLLGRAHFSAAPEAEGPWTKVREGHLTDFSVGYRVGEAVWIPAGEKQKIKGRDFDGPLRVVTKWTPRELSVCPIGADQRAKARSIPTKEKDKMDELRKFLVSLGMKEDATDDEMRAFQAEIKRKATEAPKAPETPAKPVDTDAERAEAVRAERARITEISEMCRTWEVPTETVSKLIDEGQTVDAAREQVMAYLEKKKKDPVLPDSGGRATLIFDERDKFREAAEGAVLIRSGIPGEHDKILGARDLAGYSLVEMARHSLVLANKSPHGNALEMVGRAMTTSDFPYILANVAHKSLFTGWETAEETWNQWCATGSVSDFKTHYSPRVSEFSDLEEIPEDTEYKHGSRTEAQESYQIATYGKLATISRQAVINDDLNAITMNFMGMGEAAARKIGDLPYAVLTANEDMGDSTALFHATHGNFVDDGSGAAPGIETIAAGILAMKSQTDLQGLRRLNIRPQFFLAPAALEGVAEVFFRSEKFADEDTIATDSSLAATRTNPYSGTYFTRIYETRLDDNDTAAWYLAARKGKTVTVFFLNGVQTPYMEQQAGWEVDGTEFKVRIDAGAKAMDYRGLYFNDGN